LRHETKHNWERILLQFPGVSIIINLAKMAGFIGRGKGVGQRGVSRQSRDLLAPPLKWRDAASG
jgi:hypothetical protein